MRLQSVSKEMQYGKIRYLLKRTWVLIIVLCMSCAETLTTRRFQ